MKVSDETILAALEVYDSAADVVAATGAPLRRVIYLQRLYGPLNCQLDRRNEDAKRRQKAKAFSAVDGPGSVQKKLESPQGDYWRRFEGLDQPNGRSADFNVYLESMIEGLRRRRGGRAAS